MSKSTRQYDGTIDRVDNMIRQNNRKYLDQKSQIQYQKALQQYEKQKKRQIAKNYAQQIKQGNKKAIQKKQKQISMNKAKSRVLNKSTVKAQYHQKQAQKPQPKARQKLSSKQVKKVQKAVQARAQRHLQEIELEKINKKLEEEKKKTRLFQLRETCQKLISKSHKRVPSVSMKIPEERRVLLQKLSLKAQEEVEQLDNIISGLIQKSKGMKQHQGHQHSHSHSHSNSHKHSQQQQYKNKHYQNRNMKRSDDSLIERDRNVGSRQRIGQMDVFSDEFEIEFMKEIISGNANMNNNESLSSQSVGRYKVEQRRHENSRNENRYVRQSPQDWLFTKPASQLFQMNYIPIN